MYYFHRIQIENDAYSKGIEIHENLDSAILAFWGRMKLGYNNPSYPGMTFVSCKITDENGNVVKPYDRTWLKEPEENNAFFLHYIRVDGETTTKGIDAYTTRDEATVAFATQMEYGYGNSKFPNVTMVSCEITDLLSGGMVLEEATWNKPVEESVEPEVTE